MTYPYPKWNTHVDFSELKGKVLTKIEKSDDDEEIRFYCDDGCEYRMYHEQDCCERVTVEDVIGNFDDLIGSEILMAEYVTNSGENPSELISFTWTFYKLATVKGYVTIRWYGESNGYYSESVSFAKVR